MDSKNVTNKNFIDYIEKWPLCLLFSSNRIQYFCKYLNRQAWANSVDLDQMQHKTASDQNLHYLPLIQQYFKHI